MSWIGAVWPNARTTSDRDRTNRRGTGHADRLAMRSLVLLVLIASCSQLDVEHDNHFVPDAFVVEPDPCSLCTVDQICVEEFGIDCAQALPSCVPRTIEDACAPSNASCSADCQEAYCHQPYQCEYRNGCPASPLAFTCYGP
jgi:hypothetical protein